MEISHYDNLGASIYPDSWGVTFTYNGDGTVNYAQTTNGSNTWRRTYTYDGAKRITAESVWTRQ